MLKLSSDRKVSPLNRKAKGGDYKPLIPNSFGLPAGTSCPGKTPFCNSCYADRLERFRPVIGNLVDHNLTLLKACRGNVQRMSVLLSDAIQAFLTAHYRHLPTTQPVFRIHWDGDFYSFQYAKAWATTIRQFPEVHFWTYTRSFDFVSALSDLPNLSLYLSVDEFNVEGATAVLTANPWVRLAFCADTWQATEDLASRFPQERKGPRCPELTKKTPLVSAEGVGACIACGLCIYGKNNVRFATKH